jgi:predicted methyltransferase
MTGRLRNGALALLALALGACRTTGQGTAPGIAAAVSDPGRPAADRDRDGRRHPAELMAFAGVKPGQRIADYMPGGGYFTRIFAKAAGPQGHVYAVFPAFLAEFDKRDAEAVKALAGQPAYANVTYATTPNGALQVAEPLDLVWTSDNYHDLQFGLSHDQIIALDKAIFAALKPGGALVVVDHVAAPGSGWTAAPMLHRIDPEAIKADMAAAGFRMEAEDSVLRNPKDPHTAVVFDPSIRGRTDQVVLRFRKPG